MCGITGTTINSSSYANDIRLMTQSIKHRGPDSNGYWEDGLVSLGHRRLSIIDLSDNANQPMTSLNKDIVIVYNGEIYNYQEIKEELINKGHTFSTKSDTEVIIASYQEWGVQAFKRFNGMFAFAIYDQIKKQLFLVRDHAGIKPLYFHISDQKIIFSSEVKAFKAYDPNWKPNEDWSSLFLTFGFIPPPHTTLKDVFSLSKGAYLVVNTSNREFEQKQYNKFTYSNLIRNENEALDLVRSTFTDAVKRNMISDAPLGIFLSGGIDSSLVALVADSLGYKNLNTLSITFDESTFDESPYQKIVLDKMRTHKHTNYKVGATDFIENLDDIFAAIDQPSTDSINSYFVSKAAHNNGLKVALSGLGGDELFGGYPSFNRINSLRTISQIPNSLLRATENFPNEKIARLAYLGMNSNYKDYLFLRGMFSPKMVTKITGRSIEGFNKLFSELQIEDYPLRYDKNLAAFLETNIYMENQLLKDSDYMSMWNSLELRVPFLDKELMQIMHTISPSVKFNSNRPKYLITKAFEHLLPEQIVFRKKQGFTFPFSIWLKKHIEVFKPMLPDTPVTNKILSQFFDGKVHWSRLWSLIVYNKFIQ